MVLSSFDGVGVGFGFGIGCGFGVGWGFGGKDERTKHMGVYTNSRTKSTVQCMPLNTLGLGVGGGCGVGFGLGWGFGNGFGCKYRSSEVVFYGIDFKEKADGEKPPVTAVPDSSSKKADNSGATMCST